MKKHAISLCGAFNDPSNCPEVSVSKTDVTIGEDENTVKLKPGEWNKLVELVKQGKLTKVKV